MDYIDGEPVRKSIEYAQKAIAEPGYPDGVSKETGKRLVLYYDTTSSGVDDRCSTWLRREQFKN